MPFLFGYDPTMVLLIPAMIFAFWAQWKVQNTYQKFAQVKAANGMTGRAMAQTWGLPEYKFLAMPHPIANLTEAQLDQRAREIAPEVVKLLLQGQE